MHKHVQELGRGVAVASLLSCSFRVSTDTSTAATESDSAESDDPEPTDSAPVDTDDEVGPDSDTEPTDPCAPAIPATAVVVSDDASITEDGAVAWVCGNDTLSYSGTGARLFIEGGAVLSGGGNTVYALSGAEIHNFASDNVLVVADEGVLVDESAGATVHVCPTLAFDTTNAPEPGC